MPRTVPSRKRLQGQLKSNSVKAGLGAFAFGIANLILQIKLTPEGVHMMWFSPPGISIIVLFALGTYLILSSIWTRELSFPEKKAIEQQRQKDLPLLRASIDAILTRQQQLAFQIARMPLDSFFDKYLQINRDYRRYRQWLHSLHGADEQTQHKMAVLLSIARFFFPKTICLNDICRDDDLMSKLDAEKAIYYHRNTDRKLSRIIDQLLDDATKYHSVLALAELATHSGIQYKDVKHHSVFQERPRILKRFVARAYKAMNNRIDLLMRGEDL